MASKNFPCKYLSKVNFVSQEVGDGISPTIIPNQPKCLLNQSYFGMDWNKCEQTPVEGPCWQFPGQFASIEEWDDWAKQQLRNNQV